MRFVPKPVGHRMQFRDYLRQHPPSPTFGGSTISESVAYDSLFIDQIAFT